MRLWHYKLLSVLPRAQLLSQWRECVAIAKGLKETGRTNHILINKIMDYPLDEFRNYCGLVYEEMTKRGYAVSKSVLEKMFDYISFDFRTEPKHDEVFNKWHTQNYLRQCYYNLEEKWDCGGIPDKEWNKILEFMLLNSEIVQNAIKLGIVEFIQS